MEKINSTTTHLHKRYTPLLVLITMCICACEKQELAVEKYNRGDVVTEQIALNNNYKHQVWYSLSTAKAVSTNLKTDWDIALETSSTGRHIKLNSSKNMRAYKTNHTQLANVTDTTGLYKGTADVPSGNLDSTSLDNELINVYILNAGYNENGKQQGYFKLKIIDITNTHYTIEYANLLDNTTKHATINKNGAYNYNYFSFITNAQVSIAPPKTDYDLCFTQYTDVFHNPFQYYLVTGVLLNKYSTTVAKIFNKEFSSITLADTINTTFYNNEDAIGYEWKSFSLTTNVYTVDVKKCYLIKDSKGFYYKLHFIDFYNQQGQKGYPKFEFKKL
jgi:hypothetical protein